MRPQPLSSAELSAALAELPAWRIEHGRLRRSLRFADFDRAFAFMTRVADAARRLDHHPDWSNRFAKVEIELVTHDVGALTRLDLELARAIEAALAD